MKKKSAILLTLCILLATVPVFGESVTKSIQATYRNIQIVVNGVQVDLTDENGASMEPFIYNGRTYLPVAAVAKALDQDVSWDGATSTVYIGSVPQKAAKKISIVHMPYLERTAGSFTFIKDEIYYFDTDPGSITYALNGQATAIGGSFYVTNTGGQGKLRVYGSNDELLYESTYTEPGINPIPFEVNVENQLTVKLEFDCVGTYYGFSYCVSGPYIITTDY